MTTIEGLAVDGAASGAGSVNHGGLQCGYCTPGFIMTAVAMLNDNRTRPSRRSGTD